MSFPAEFIVAMSPEVGSFLLTHFEHEPVPAEVARFLAEVRGETSLCLAQPELGL